MSTTGLKLETVSVRLAVAPRRWSARRLLVPGMAFWLLSGFFLVAPDQQAVVTRFGKVVAPRVMPGLHYAVPWPVERVSKLRVRQLQRLIVGGDVLEGTLGRQPALAAQFLTGDQNLIQLRVAVQYSVSVPADYLFQLENPSQVVGAAVEAELARRVAQRAVDAVLTTEKAAIQEEVRAAAQRILDGYRSGVALSTINIEVSSPPPEAAAAFRDVASARADTARLISDAQGYTNDLIPRARGLARQSIEEATGYREKKINEAAGDAARFRQFAAESAKASQITGQRLYLETMEQVLPRIRKVILDRNGSLDLTIIRKGDASAPKQVQ